MPKNDEAPVKQKNVLLSRARKHIEEQVKKNEDKRRDTLLRKRAEFVAQGVKSLDQRQHAEAVASFRNFILLLETSKGIGDGELLPAHFDPKTETGDLLLLAGVYWELAKIFDRMKGKGAPKEFHAYLEKYIVFSKGMPYQALCAEAIRRYKTKRSAVNIVDFKNAYAALGGDKCFVATSLMDVTAPGTLALLRAYRDDRLSLSPAGRGFIRAYYVVGPYLALLMNQMPQPVRKLAGAALERLAVYLG